MDVIVYSLVAFAGLFLYLLPAFVGRHKRNAQAILWLNILLGWTLLGWVGALIWALASEQAPPAMVSGYELEDYPAEPSAATAQSKEGRYARLKRLRDEGIITQDEFMDQISR